MSDPDVSPIKGNQNVSSQRSRSQSVEEREDEGDSGIAVIESSQTVATVSVNGELLVPENLICT